MNANVCTLFEGHYHYGVGALTNSLYKGGFRGTMWAGYRGELPSWAQPLTKEKDYQVYQVTDDCRICFVPLSTDYHLANYKPTFMLELMEKYAPEADKLFYFDPDIVTRCEWSFLDEWAEEGIAVCEDVNSPLYVNHPIRLGWVKFLKTKGQEVNSNFDLYINSGFVGIHRSKKSFLKYWHQTMLNTESVTGSLSVSFIPGMNGKRLDRPRTALFYGGDQDTFNVAVMAFEKDMVVAGKDAMDFMPGGYIMSHSLGRNKPWVASYMKQAMQGKKIAMSHKQYWENVDAPIQLYPAAALKKKKLSMNIAKIVTRFNHA